MAGMDNRPVKQPNPTNNYFWRPPAGRTPATNHDGKVLEEIIDSYAAMTTEPSGSQAVSGDVTSPKPQRKRKNRVQRTPSPVPGLQLPDFKKRKTARSVPHMTPPSPSPAPQSAPLATQMVPPYQVTDAQALPHGAYTLAEMPPMAPLPPSEPVFVPLPRHGFIHELPLCMAPHTFTPMFVSPNGRFQYYVFADDDGVTKVALIGRVSEMQATYQDLACSYPVFAAQPFGPGPAH